LNQSHRKAKSTTKEKSVIIINIKFLRSTAHLLLLLLLITIVVNCTEEKLIPENKLIDIYVDILITQDTVSAKNISTDSIKTLVLAKYDVSDSLYNRTIQYYNQNPERWEKFFDRAIKYLEKLKAQQK